jgi:RND family efflux transporter MFP subunit
VIALVALLALSAVVVACPKHEAPEEEPKPSALVETTPLARGAIEESVTAYGKVEPAADATEPVVAELDSTVVKLWVRAGQLVKRGEAIAEVRETKAVRLDAAKAKIDVDFAEKEVARVTSMRDKGLATNADVAAAEAARDKAKAELAALGGAGGTKTVRAPSAGLVQSVVVKPGDAVAAGGPLVLLSSAGGERVRLGIEPADLTRIKVGAVVHVRALYASNVVDGAVSQVHPQVDVETHQAGAVAALVGSPLLEGSTVRGDIVVRREESALLVPRKSIVDGALCIVDGGKAKRIAVDVVIDDGAHVAIEPKGELKEGALVITTGAAELEDGMAVRTIESPGAATHEKQAETDAKEGQ